MGIKARLMGVEVGVAPVTKDTVPVYLSFVGTTSSVQKVDIRARVKGFLTEVHFKEGDNVKEGDLMFVIDESEYKTAVDELTAQAEKDGANLDFANEQVERYKKLVDKEYVSREAYDKYVTDAKQAQAALDADNANLDKAKLNLGYCRMYAPLDGRVGRMFVHIGNLVGAAEETVLATVVQLDPMYVYFYPSEQQYREIVEFQKKNRLRVDLSFSDGEAYPNKGEVDFIDNVANQQTNTVAMRAVFPNPDRVMLPDVYVNASLLLNEQPDTLLVPQKAVMQGQEGPHVYVVDDKGLVKERLIGIQFTYEGNAAIGKGLSEGERVVVDGVQKVRPGMKVKTTDVR
jgi:RND family efflux transporter MFP subunit